MSYWERAKELKSSKLFRNILAMISGTTLAQLLPLAVSPILSRYYTETDFGIMASITSIAAIIGVGISGRYQLAIMLPKSSQKAFSVALLSFIITICLSVVLTLLILLLPTQISSLLGINGIENWLIYIPLTALGIGIWNILNMWVSRAANFKINAFSKVIQASGNSTASVLFSKIWIAYLQAGGLIIGRIIGFFASSLNMILFFLKDRRKQNLSINLKEIKKVAGEYSDYPKFNLIPALLNTFSMNIIFLVLGKYYSVQDLGYYNLTNFSLIAPVTLISTSIRAKQDEGTST